LNPSENEMAKSSNEKQKPAPPRNASSMVLKVKDEISKEINKLMFQEKNSNISAVQDVIAKEMLRRRKKDSNKGLQDDDEGGLTSVHHMAVEHVIKKWRAIIKRKRE